jgi:5-methylcytosine-specific restriction protein A
MAKLKSLMPTIKPMTSLITSAPAGLSKSQSRDVELPWRKWYKTARWQRLRLDVFARDGFMCQRTGVFLNGVHPAPNSPVANHKIPHRGDWDLFWDIDNLETVSKAVHDSEIQKQEKASLGRW